MTLKEFLADKDGLSHLDALAAARAHPVANGRLVPATTVNQAFASLNLTGIIKDIAEDKDHPARHKLASVLLSIQGNHDFNFIQGTEAGDGNLLALDWLVVALPELESQLQAFKAGMVARASVVSYPFARVTLHDIKLERGNCETSDNVQIVGRQAVIELNGEFEPHKPRLLAFNEITEQWQRINNFANTDNSPCSEAGKYTCIIPPQFVGWPLEVDDPYGAVV